MGAEEIAEEVFYDCRERQKRRNKQKVPPKTETTCHRHRKHGAKTRKCAAPETCKWTKKIAPATSTDEVGEYDEEHEFSLNTTAWIDGVDDTEIEEVFYDCVDVEDINWVHLPSR